MQPRISASRAVWAIGVLLAIWSLTPFLVLLVDVARHGGVLSGSGGASAGADQFQYLSWIRESGEHGLIADRFQLAPPHAVFVEPMFLLSGLAWRLGLGVGLALALWQPVAIVVMLAGFAAYASRSESGSARIVVLLLALFCVTPVLPALDWIGHVHFQTRFELLLGMEELSPVWGLWGYLPSAVSIGLMPLALLASERATDLGLDGRGGSRPRYLAYAATAGALVGWLHPWQGATLILVWTGMLLGGPGVRARSALVLPMLATLIPLGYYELLAHTDAAWKLSRAQSSPEHLYLAVLAALLPFALLALPALISRPRSAHDRITRLWLAAGLTVYLTPQTFPLHALQGLSLPLAILAVAGWRRLAWHPIWAVPAVCIAIIPGAIWSASWYRDSIRSHLAPYVFTGSERAALSFLERSPRPGGVLAGPYLGMAVPAFTGRATWVGHRIWTPDFLARAREVGALFGGRMSPPHARAFVRSSGAAWILTGCGVRRDLRRLLAPGAITVHRFGCVTVYAL